MRKVLKCDFTKALAPLLFAQPWLVTIWVQNQKIPIAKPMQTQNMGLGFTLGYVPAFLVPISHPSAVTVSILFNGSSF